LNQLFLDYPNSGVIDVLSATNMISVGVDIDRLGLMIVLGQPKTTSEYIQASSRVGRSHPGIVFTLYSPVKSRDRSHFEQFVKYHQSLYRHVEPTSVTPFSAPVRDKALHALLFTLIRHMLGLREDADLKDFDKSSAEYQAILDKLLQRVKTIDPLELLGTEKEVTELSSRLEELINYADLTYAKTKDKDKAVLMKPAQDIKDKGEYRTPQSMRSTDAECYVTLDYS
jgi:superfamily II DNA/RNA helicase